MNEKYSIIIVVIGIYIFKINIAKDKILDEYIKLGNYENKDIGSMPYILVELKLETEDNIDLLTSEINDATTYIKSNTKYEDFKEKLLQYVTEEYFLENFSQYKNIDGYAGFCNCRAEIIKVEVYDHYLNGENVTESDYLFNEKVCFEYVNNKLVISQWQ